MYRQGSVVANSIVTYSTTSYSSVAALANAINSKTLQNTFQQVFSSSTNGNCTIDGLTNFIGCDKVTATMAPTGELCD